MIDKNTAYSKLKLPAVGDLLRTNGNLSNEGSNGLYWSASPNGNKGYYLIFNTNVYVSSSYHRAR